MAKGLFGRKTSPPAHTAPKSRDGGSSRTKAKESPTSQVAEVEARRITHDEIAARAYEIWICRGRPEGTDRENWEEAERQLREESRQKKGH